jgi:hypothetical protein
MSILFMDNFSIYGTGLTGRQKMMAGIWAAATGNCILDDDPDGVSGGQVLRLSDSGSASMRKVFDQGQQTTVGCHVRVYFPTIESTNTSFIGFPDQDAAGQVGVRMDASGYLHAYKGSTLLGSSDLPVIVADSWIHLEARLVVSNTVGEFELRINEDTVIGPLTNIDTQDTANTEVSGILLANGSNNTVYFRDLICWSGDGAQNNDFLGDHSVVSLAPTGDTVLNWTPSTGSTGYDLIDETTPLDTDYVYADDAPPGASEFELADLDPDVVVVAGLQTVVRALKTDSGAANLQVSLNSDGNSDAGADRPISTSATYYLDVSELDPATSAPWTPAAVDDATVSIDRTI